jgi:hypothetical protein
MALTPAASADAGDWIVDDIRRHPRGVSFPMPTTFDAYARVFHPLARGVGATIPEVSWREVAEVLDTVFHPGAQWDALSAPTRRSPADERPFEWDGAPDEGSLAATQLRALASTLSVHTGTPSQCWFGVWVGWAELAYRWRAAPVLELSDRSMALLEGSITDASADLAEGPGRHQSANLWWPADRRWLVSTEVDAMTTYVGGDIETIEAAIGTPELEAARVPREQTQRWFPDEHNRR